MLRYPPEYILPSPKKKVISLKENKDGTTSKQIEVPTKSDRVENWLKPVIFSKEIYDPGEVLSLGEFMKETEEFKNKKSKETLPEETSTAKKTADPVSCREK